MDKMDSFRFPELYTKGTQIWIKHPTEVWQCAEIKENFDKNSGQLFYLLTNNQTEDNEKEQVIKISETLKELPPLKNPEILIGSNDLTSLSYLHEPSVLYNLRVRFLQRQQIYTWCGIVLVAINPFTDLEIYSNDTIQMYHSNLANLQQLDPHIYAVAEDAFTKLECNNINQSVIVSGESGAGKTVSAKFAMRYFASIAGSDSNIETRVLATNPIMEAIGNAKTVRNDNSSRFGKYIQILFDRRTRHIMGGNMRTYLLEKSRVTYQSKGERNFHIFYQLCSYARANKLDYLGLSDSSKEFNYLGSNEKSAYDDMTRFLEAFDTLGFVDNQKDVLYRVIAAILHGGNIVFVNQPDEESCVLEDNDALKSLQLFCKLLDLNESSTLKWLTSRLLKTGTREIITTSLNAQTAQYGLEALLKFIYEKMFQWIVSLINHSLGPVQTSNEYQFIGVLDIYGFEHFENNSFEQFCINYANEVLQQQFNLHVFKLEQDEYLREGIEWQFISFTDNQQVIDLIQSKPIGILCLLDEECRMPQGTDTTWCSKLYKQIPTGAVFKKPKFNFQSSFIIEHFADVVTYNVEGFLEKNRDTIWEEQIDLLRRSEILNLLFVGNEPLTPNLLAKKSSSGKIKVGASNVDQQRQKKKAKATIGYQFRESLDALMLILNSTEPHYVRCIKPNDDKAAFQFNNIRAVQQLRACGVLETIRISSNGYPSRWSYQDFANRYRVLKVGYSKSSTQNAASSKDKMVRPKPTPRKLVRAGSSFAVEIRQVCEEIVQMVYEEKVYSQFNQLYNDNQQQRKPYQFGKTKIFFRAGQVAILERIRAQKLRECTVLIQKIVRGWLQRKRYQRMRNAALTIQRYHRGWLARKHYHHLRQTKNAIIIQTRWRGYYQRRKYQKLRHCVLKLQTRARGVLARRKFLKLRQNLAAVTIQRFWRGYAARKKYKDTLDKIIVVQSCIRRYFAKKEYRRLRIEARSVEHVTNLNRGLEKKIMTLQHKIDDLIEENRNLKITEGRYNNLKQEMEQVETEMTELKTRQRENNLQIEKYNSEMSKLSAFIKELENKNQILEQNKVELEDKVRLVIDNKNQILIDNEKIESTIKQREQELRAEFEIERKRLIEEREQEQISKQQLISQCMEKELEQSKDSERSFKENMLQDRPDDFDSNVEMISIMMQCTELEQELKRSQNEIQKLRDQLANNAGDKDSSAALLAKQFQGLQDELDRYKKERTDLKRVILIDDHIKTFTGDQNQKKKYQEDLVSTYKDLFAKMDEEIASKDKLINQLRNEISHLKCSTNTLPNSINYQKSIDYHPQPYFDNLNSSHKSFRGMFKFQRKDMPFIARYLFYEIRPTNGFNRNNQCDSHTIAFISYMCLRYIDSINDEKLTSDFMTNMITWFKKMRTDCNENSLDTLVHLLACQFKVNILIKYYSEYDIDKSGDKDSGFEGKPNEKINGTKDGMESDEDHELDSIQALKNFDLSEFIHLFKELIQFTYTRIIKLFEKKIKHLIVAAVLEHQEISGSKRKKMNSNSDSDSGPPSPTEDEMDILFKELSNMQALFRAHRLDEHFDFQFFKQIYFFIGATALNNLIMRKDLCTNDRAFEIIYNLSLFEQFLRENNIIKWDEIKAGMDPIIQATKLLISTKTEKQISAIVDTTKALNVSQVMKIIKMHSDVEQISADFIKKLNAELIKNRVKTTDDEIKNKKPLIELNIKYPFLIPYIDVMQNTESVLHVTGLNCNFRYFEIPTGFHKLEKYLEKI